MRTLYEQYKSARNGSMPHYTTSAINALRHVRYEANLKAWKESIGANSFYTDNENIAHEYTDDKTGVKYVFKIEMDDHSNWQDIEAQGYDVETNQRRAPEFFEFGSFTRHSGDGFKAYLSYGQSRDGNALFDVPEKYVRQFYSPKQYAKHAAYVNMVASARLAIEQDKKNYLETEYAYISITAYDKDGEEIASDGLGGVDYNYAMSGSCFYEQVFTTVKDEVQKYLDAQSSDFAAHLMQSRPDMYETAKERE